MRTEIFGSTTSSINLNLFTVEDQYVSPRVKKDSRVLTPEVQTMGRAVMQFVGAGPNGNKFDTRNSELSQLQNGTISNQSVLRKINYTQKDLMKSLESVRVFYSNKLSVTDVNTALNRKKDSRKCTDDKVISDSGKIIIAGKTHIFNNAQFKLLSKSTEVTTYHMSAPDLNQNNTAFLANKNLNKELYKQEMLTRAELLLHAAKVMKDEAIVIPSIGAGAFANGHGPEVAEIIAGCFRSILENGGWPIKNIIFSVTNKHYDAYAKVFNDYKGKINVVVTEAEMTNVAIKLVEKNLKVGYIIAANPTAKIGCGWKVKSDGSGAQAQEETCTKHLVDYVRSFDPYLNPKMLMQDNWKPVNTSANCNIHQSKFSFYKEKTVSDHSASKLNLANCSGNFEISNEPHYSSDGNGLSSKEGLTEFLGHHNDYIEHLIGQ